ncbi:MAG TPA: CHASE3 domain-containing protein [Xanthobacteraceae bacterium]|nr:CHASE3 domain-containing protein [Xanthobacteraceae bacterium]
MFNTWTVKGRLIAGFAVAGLTLILIAVVAYRNAAQVIENDGWVTHTYQVRGDLALLATQLTDAQTGERGYLITGDESFLAPYRNALGSLKGTLERLRQLTMDNPDQQRRLAALSPILETRLNELRQTVDLRRTDGLDAAAKLLTSNLGKGTTEQVHNLIAEADQQEANLLKTRLEEAHNSAHATVAIILWGGLVGAATVLAIGWLITSSLARQIAEAVNQVRSSSTELQAAANQQATGAKEQAAAMTEISTTITELLATSRQIAESAQRVAQNAEQTASAARSGHGTVDTTHELIGGIRRQVDQIVSHMLDLGKKSQEVGAVLDIVSELAEQTNILAINATIEAAGAGDAGKRFAVVADEIRKLADRVGDSTKEVRTLIEDVRSAVNTTVMATETGSKAVDAGSRQFGDVATAFRQIASLVGTTTEAAREIELSTKQQSSAVEQVNLAIASVTQASVETETSAGQTLQTVSQMAALSRDLLRIIQPQLAA